MWVPKFYQKIYLSIRVPKILMGGEALFIALCSCHKAFYLERSAWEKKEGNDYGFGLHLGLLSFFMEMLLYNYT